MNAPPFNSEPVPALAAFLVGAVVASARFIALRTASATALSLPAAYSRFCLRKVALARKKLSLMPSFA